MAQGLSVGDIVLFPHSGGMSKGSVREIYGDPPRVKVVITMTPELTGEEIEEPTTVVWPIERVSLVQSAA
jgi:hypothetical protein